MVYIPAFCRHFKKSNTAADFIRDYNFKSTSPTLKNAMDQTGTESTPPILFVVESRIKVTVEPVFIVAYLRIHEGYEDKHVPKGAFFLAEVAS